MLASGHFTVSYAITVPDKQKTIKPPGEQGPSSGVNTSSVSQEIPRKFSKPSFSTAFTSARHFTISSAISMQVKKYCPLINAAITILNKNVRRFTDV
jgi:hypothetical protein